MDEFVRTGHPARPVSGDEEYTDLRHTVQSPQKFGDRLRDPQFLKTPHFVLTSPMKLGIAQPVPEFLGGRKRPDDAEYGLMTHRIFTGPFAALETKFIACVAELQKDDPLAPVSVLVGSNLLASYLKYRIAETGRAAANLRFYTFIDLAVRLGPAPSLPLRRERLPRLGPSWILADLLEAENWPPFSEVSGYLGFREAVLETFRDLRDAGVSPIELEESLPRLAKEMPDRERHLRAVAGLYRSYRERVELFWDVDDDFRQAIKNALHAAKILESDHLLAYGVYDVTGQQADLLKSIGHTLEMTYFIPYVDDHSSAFALPFLEQRAEELGVRVETLNAEERGDSLRLLTSRLFASRQSGNSLNPDGTVALVSAPGESRVAVEIIREILRAVRDKVISGFHQAAVVLRHPEEQVPLLAEAFRLRQIPYFVHGGSPFAERPLCKAVMAIVRLQAEAFSRRAVLKVMELIGASLPAGAANSWDAPRWRALTHDLTFLAGADSWDAGTAALIRRFRRDLQKAEAQTHGSSELLGEEAEGRFCSVTNARQRLEEAEALRARWLTLRLAAADWPDFLPWKDWAELLEQKIQPLIGLSVDWPSFAAILDELRSLGELTETARMEPRVPRAKVAAYLEESFSILKREEGRFLRSGVNLLSITAARGLRFPVVIVPGLDEGRFPARLRQDPLLLDKERWKIGRRARLPLKSGRGEEERLLFSMAARSAQRRLVLLTSRLDESSDRERIPSDFFLRAAAAARGRIVGLRDLSEEAISVFRSVGLDSPAPREGEVAVDEAEVRLRLIAFDPQPARVLEALAALEPFRLAAPRAFDRARWERHLTGFDGYLRDPILVRLVTERFGAGAGPVSPSRLELYAKCPYQFFLQRVIGLEAWEEPEPVVALDPLRRGQIIHEILESFLKEISGEGLSLKPPEELQTLLWRRAEKYLASKRPEGIPDLLWEIERDALLALLRSWLEYEIARAGRGFVPAHFEYPFGEFPSREKLPAYRVQAGRYVFEFRGRIDRIDLSPDRQRARVIDYKTGKLPRTMDGNKGTALMGGEKMQLAVYRAALSVLPELDQLQSVEAEYLHLQPGNQKIAPRPFSEDELNRAAARLPKVLEIIGEGIEGGLFYARTSGLVRPEGHCKYCDYLAVCGKDRVRREDWKASDPRVRRFLQITEGEGAAEEEE